VRKDPVSSGPFHGSYGVEQWIGPATTISESVGISDSNPYIVTNIGIISETVNVDDSITQLTDHVPLGLKFPRYRVIIVPCPDPAYQITPAMVQTWFDQINEIFGPYAFEYTLVEPELNVNYTVSNGSPFPSYTGPMRTMTLYTMGFGFVFASRGWGGGLCTVCWTGVPEYIPSILHEMLEAEDLHPHQSGIRWDSEFKVPFTAYCQAKGIDMTSIVPGDGIMEYWLTTNYYCDMWGIKEFVSAIDNATRLIHIKVINEIVYVRDTTQSILFSVINEIISIKDQAIQACVMNEIVRAISGDDADLVRPGHNEFGIAFKRRLDEYGNYVKGKIDSFGRYITTKVNSRSNTEVQAIESVTVINEVVTVKDSVSIEE